ncbi:hypothetical protein GOBAR_DD14305 [Gossypium barbadense]|nr:hypothetical protein GOBAR_DD14305 [Gossypium barbadense]
MADEDSSRERERERLVRKRSEHDFDSFDRRKAGFDREFPKGFRSERDRTRRESVCGSSWRRLGIDDVRGSSKVQLRDVRDVSSPTRSRDSLGAGRVVGESREREDLRRRSSKAMSTSMSRSPTWSRDSGSEQSKSVGGGMDETRGSSKVQLKDVRDVSSPTRSRDSLGAGRVVGESREEDLKRRSSKSKSKSSEMEEGEFDPEPQAKCETDLATEAGTGNDGKESCQIEMENVEGGMIPNVEGLEEVNEEVVNKRENDVKDDGELQDCRQNLNGGTNEVVNRREGDVKDNDELQDCGQNLSGGTSGSGDKMDDVAGGEVGKEEEGLKGSCKENKGINLEMQLEECEAAESNEEVAEENGEHKINMHVVEIGLSQNVKDKGKGVAVESTNITDSAANGVWNERESKATDLETEGPSRGFELFSHSPVRRVEKPEQPGANKKEEKLAFESLDLSLSLPNVLLPIGARDTDEVPGSPSHGRSVQSLTNTFRTNSDGFTASMSFSGSQSFYHNPSCSLTQNSMDYEQSVHSRPIFQCVDQLSQGASQSQNESRHKDIPMFQRILMNGNGSFNHSSELQGNSNSQAVQAQNMHTLDGSSKIPNVLEQQLSLQNDVRSPSQSFGSHEIASNYSFENKRGVREKHGGSLYRSRSQKEQEKLLLGGADCAETVMSSIVSEPILVMARKFYEMMGQSVACLKDNIHKIMLDAGKQGQLRALQEALRNRSDLTLEMLLKSHRGQLEILVSLKTGLPDYLRVDDRIPSSNFKMTVNSTLPYADSSKPDNTTVLSGKEQQVKGVNGMAGPCQDATRLKPVYSDKALQLESASSLLPGFHVDRTGLSEKRPLESELERSGQKQPFLPELDSFVRIKLEEAKMYQARADDARRDAESLKRIAITKDEKIEEEYKSRIKKLRLVEAEEMRKQKFEEFQALERAYRECYGMKTRMEADIKDLLLKMEATRRNLAM